MAGDNNLYILTKNIPAKIDSFNYFEIVFETVFEIVFPPFTSRKLQLNS